MKLNLLSLCLIIVCICVSCNLAEVTVATFADPKYPNQCVVQGMVLPPGQVIRHPDMCAKIKCRQNSKASVVTCPAMVPPQGCVLGEHVDAKANYPNCCRKKILCDNGITFNS